MVDVKIEPMQVGDIEAVHAIESQVFPTPWSLNVYRNELTKKEHNIYLVAKIDDTVIGYICLFYILDEGHITNIAVDPDYQNLKIGTQLILEEIRRAIEEGVRRLTLEVRVSNSVAQHLYEKFGFYPTGRRRGYYTDTREDALVYWTDDITSPEYQERLENIKSEIRLGAA